jgi:hypothetical protein
MAENKKMKTLTLGGETFEVTDEVARNEISKIKEEGSGGVQPDLAQNDPTAPDYVKNRTHYEELVEFIPETSVVTVANEQYGGLCMAMIESPVIEDGKTYLVVFNGDNYRCIAKEGGLGNEVIMGGEDSGEPFFMIPRMHMLLTKTAMEATIAVYEQNLIQLENKFLRDDVTKYGAIGEVTVIEWDGNSEGLESFVCNDFNYYKVSDIAIPFEHLAHSITNVSGGNNPIDEKDLGTNCYDLRSAIVVTKAGSCKDSSGIDFNAPSVGTYMIKHNYTTGLEWCNYVEFDTRRENSILYLTNPCGVKYAITVDDNGNLTATALT